jgi:putative addiction module antidote
MFRLKIRRVGNSLGVTLPAEAARQLQVREGDLVYLVRTPEGFRLTANDPEFEAAMQAAEGFMARYRNALRALAK